jgi:Tol biopolymer transport system component
MPEGWTFMPARKRSIVPLAAAVVIASGGGDARGQVTERITVGSSGVQANAVSAPAIAFSAGGDVVAFSSDATNLAPGDTNRVPDIFVRDRRSGMTHRVSVAAPWGQANGMSIEPDLSDDGRVVAFVSEATNLVRPRPRGERFVVVRDLESRFSERVDVSSAGRPSRGVLTGPALLSADGRHVTFTSDAPGLVEGDANGAADVFVRDRATGDTTRASVDSAGMGGEGVSVASAMSRDGRYVVFVSRARLAPESPEELASVYVRDRVAGTTTWVGAAGDDVFDAGRGAISDDGRFVAFEQRAETFGVRLWDRLTRETTCIACWDDPPDAEDTLTGMSADGRRIAFQLGTRTFPRNSGRGPASVFLHDRATGLTQRITDSPRGGAANGHSFMGGLSPDGRFVGFSSDASNLLAGDTNRRTDLFVRGPL